MGDESEYIEGMEDYDVLYGDEDISDDECDGDCDQCNEKFDCKESDYIKG